MRLGLGLGLGSNRGGGGGPPPNPAPTDIAWAGSHSVAEDAALGTVVGGALSYVDPNDTVTFSLSNDASGLFGVSGTSVIVTGVLDFETAASHNITIRATDSDGGVYDEVFAVTVTDVSETAPDDPLPEGETEDDGTFTNPVVATTVNGAVKLHGKKAAGALGKFLYDLGAPVAERIYTMEYDPDFSLLSNTGKDAMVGFVFKAGNDFLIVGNRGDGSTGLDVFRISGENKWQVGTGFTENDDGPPANGTQAGPCMIQVEISADGTTATFRTSGDDGETFDDEIADFALGPFANVSEVNQFGPGAMFWPTDTGSFSIAVSVWTDEEAAETDPDFGSVVYLVQPTGPDAGTTYAEEKAGATVTFVGNAQLDTGVTVFGGAAILYDGTGDQTTLPDSAGLLYAGEFCIEAIVRFPAGLANGSYTILSQYSGAGARSFRMFLTEGTSTKALTFTFSTDGSAATHALGSTDIDSILLDDTWTYVRADRDGAGKMRVYAGAIGSGTAAMVASKDAATGTNFNSSEALNLGGAATGLLAWNGNIRSMRITNGASRSPSDSGVPVPTAAFPLAA